MYAPLGRERERTNNNDRIVDKSKNGKIRG